MRWFWKSEHWMPTVHHFYNKINQSSDTMWISSPLSHTTTYWHWSLNPKCIQSSINLLPFTTRECACVHTHTPSTFLPSCFHHSLRMLIQILWYLTGVVCFKHRSQTVFILMDLLPELTTVGKFWVSINLSWIIKTAFQSPLERFIFKMYNKSLQSIDCIIFVIILASNIVQY